MAMRFDVAVVGAGPAGSATARRLALGGCRVLLLERSCFEGPRVGESLAPGVQPLLQDLGVWLQSTALAALPSYGTRSIWGSTDVQEHSHLMSAYGCGWHVGRPAFDRMLAEAAVAAGADLRCGTELVDVEATGSGGWRLAARPGHSDSASTLEARVLIDATGRGAHVARRLGARRIAFDHLVGVAALVGEVDTGCEGYVLVEATPGGWWYSAPVPCHQLMVMRMTDGDVCGRDRLSTMAGWSSSLAATTATQDRVRGPIQWGPRVFSAVSQRLHRPDYGAPWLAVGDAALAVDPVSGSGVIRALRYAKAGADAALAMLDGREGSAFREYEDYLDRECAAYLDERLAYYDMEQRWPDSPFWKRRSSRVLGSTPVAS